MSTKKVPKMDDTMRSNTSRRPRLELGILGNNQSQQRLNQHKLDIAYSKYLQSVAKLRLINKKNQIAEQLIDEQLTCYSEQMQQKIDETESLKQKLENLSNYEELLLKTNFLSDLMKNDLSELEQEKQIIQLTQHLQMVCNKLHLDGIKVDEEKLSGVVEKLLSISDEIKEGTNEDYLNFIQNLKKIHEYCKKVEHLHKEIKNNQIIANKLVLKATSMQLSNESESKLKE